MTASIWQGCVARCSWGFERTLVAAAMILVARLSFRCFELLGQPDHLGGNAYRVIAWTGNTKRRASRTKIGIDRTRYAQLQSAWACRFPAPALAALKHRSLSRMMLPHSVLGTSVSTSCSSVPLSGERESNCGRS